MHRSTFSIRANPPQVWTVYIEDKSDMDKVADTAHLLFSGQHPLRRARKPGFINATFFLSIRGISLKGDIQSTIYLDYLAICHGIDGP